MTTAMEIVQIIFQCIAIIFMLTFMFIGIWSFILFIKMNKHLRIKNYLLQKLNHNVCNLSNSLDRNSSNTNISSDAMDLFEDYEDDSDDNIIKF